MKFQICIEIDLIDQQVCLHSQSMEKKIIITVATSGLRRTSVYWVVLRRRSAAVLSSEDVDVLIGGRRANRAEAFVKD